MRNILFVAVLLAAFSAACNLEQEVQIELPDYDSHYVVECYLEPGKNYRLLLSRSASYFAPFGKPEDYLNDLLVNDARVSIHDGNRKYNMRSQLYLDIFDRKIFNYTSDRNVPKDYEREFRLEIILSNGDSILASARILPPVPIDSVVAQFNETDTLARVLTYFTDIPNTTNYYRRMLHESGIDSLPRQDFSVDDRFVEDVYVFGTSYDFAEGDTIFNTLYHLDRDYYLFLETLERATSSNGNPFGQPSPVHTNVRGTGNAKALGIFTGLSYDRKRTIVRK